MRKETLYPFAAMVGQEKVQRALMLTLINPRAGGLLIGGRKGTGKSVLARGIAEITPQKLLDLPLNATEDMIFGSIDLEAAVQEGERKFAPGILARATGNILYVDDINLIRTEVLTAILDANIAGFNLVERDGISFSHPVATTIVGTMNPEEGTLSSQLLDRFGLYVNTEDLTEIAQRQEIIRRQLDYNLNRDAFRRKYAQATIMLQAQVKAARQLLSKVEASEAMMQLTANLCSEALCAGHRADIYLLETARALAALAGRTYVLPQDVNEAATLVLPHRMRQQEQEQPEPDDKQDSDEENDQEEKPDEQDNQDEEEQQNAPLPPRDAENQDEDQDGPQNNDNQDEKNEQEQQEENPELNPDAQAPEEQVSDIDRSVMMPKLIFDLGQDRKLRRGSGKRSLTKTDLKQGRYVRATLTNQKVTDLAFDATIRAAAPHQKWRPANGCAINIKEEDLRQKVREKRIGSTFLFLVDASGSMGARERMKAVKGAIFALLQEAYQKRDRVGMIAFRRTKAEVLLPITRSIDLAEKCLQEMPTGGKTPLADGLATALLTLYNRNKQEEDLEPILILVTDGRANTVDDSGKDPVAEAESMAAKIGKAGITSIVIDTETDFIKLGVARKLASAMQARYFSLKELTREQLIRIVRTTTT